MFPQEDPNENGTPPTDLPPSPVPAPGKTLRSSRFGELEEHELIRLLDTIEDERARGRFRESIYISLFVWILIAWFVLYGPRLLWHQRLISPVDVLKQRELTKLVAPDLHLHPPVPRIAPKVDDRTLERLRKAEPTPAPRPLPEAPAPQPEPQPAAPTPPPPPPTPAPQPHAPVPNVPDAPHPQPATKPNFNTGAQGAGAAIQQAIHAAPRPGTGSYSASRGGSGSSGPLNFGGAEILSDTQGVDFNEYLKRILSDIRRNWYPLIPEEAQPPLNKQGETLIRFTILPDGRIGAMHLDGSTHDDAINRSAWGSITSEGQFPPLPAQFHGPNLELRIHYLVNERPDAQ